MSELTLLDVLRDPSLLDEQRQPTPAQVRIERDLSRYAAAALHEEVAAVRSASIGARNDTLNRAAFNLGQLVGAGALARGEVEDALSAAALAVGLAPREVVRTLRSGLERGMSEPRSVPERARANGYAPRAAAHAQHAAEPAWPEPIPLAAAAALPAFPVEALPGWLRAWVDAEARATQTPPDLPGMLALASLAAAVARSFEVAVRPGWREPLNIFALVVLPPGSRKSAVFRDATAPLLAYEREQAERAAPAVAQAQSARAILEARLKRAQNAAAGAASAEERDRAAHEARTLAAELATLRTPSLPRLVVDDITPEKLANVLAEQGGRLAVMSGEGGLFEIVAGRYSESANFDVLLKGHAGDDLRVDRIGRASDHVSRPALTLGLAVQPDVLEGLVRKPGFRGRGLLARLLYSLPTNTVGARDCSPPPVPPAVAREYVQQMTRLLRLEGAGGDDEPATLTPDERAYNVFIAAMEALEPRLGEDGDLAHVVDWSAKLMGAVARLAGLLHLAAGRSPAEPVDGRTVYAALQLGEYLLAHAQYAFGQMGADPRQAGAQRIVRWLERTRCERFSKRAMLRALHATAEAAEPSLALLIERGYLALAPGPQAGREGRPAGAEFLVNPCVSQGALTRSREDRHGAHRAPDGCDRSDKSDKTPPSASFVTSVTSVTRTGAQPGPPPSPETLGGTPEEFMGDPEEGAA